MGILIAAVVILALIFYAIKDLLSDRDFSSWINMALTSLILFTVILSIFMILNKRDPKEESPKMVEKPAATQPEPQKPVEQMTDTDIMLAIAEEYTMMEDKYKIEYPSEDNPSKMAADFIIHKYQFTPDEWNSFLEEAAKNDLFTKARAKRSGSDLDYLIAK